MGIGEMEVRRTFGLLLLDEVVNLCVIFGDGKVWGGVGSDVVMRFVGLSCSSSG